ncbi:MFS transporter [Lentzea tibetensis]|uniref:MFS transporter n=1 Tax=Lentzea tibetensis TaxID=2591470 RepID=A0A563EHK6_9PSEU|nr:MFS transporter [Lentzea tibetensis]TWP46109.1 MFS transporter [Lentzea tibetensis]
MTRLAVVAACLLPTALDLTILTLAVPSLIRQLGASPREVLWIADIYSLLMVSMVLVTGPFGDRIGHKRLLLNGLVIFGLASVCCAFASSPALLIAGRALLAVAASMIIPATLAIIRQIYPGDRERGFAIGVWSAVNAGGAALGPVVGGLLLEHFWWGSVFLVSVPFVVVALAAAALVLVNEPAAAPEPWEPASPLLVVAGVIGVIYTVKDLAHGGTVVLPAILGAGCLFLFVRRQLRAEHPMLDLTLFRSPLLRAGVTTVVVPVLVVVGFELLLGQHLQLALGMSPWEAAVFLLPMPLAAFFAALCGGALGLRFAVPLGLGAAAVGYAGLAASADHVVMSVCLVLIGGGYGMVQTAASDAIMSGAPPERAGSAAAVESVSYELGAGLGVALLGSLMGALTMAGFADGFRVVAVVCAVPLLLVGGYVLLRRSRYAAMPSR